MKKIMLSVVAAMAAATTAFAEETTPTYSVDFTTLTSMPEDWKPTGNFSFTENGVVNSGGWGRQRLYKLWDMDSSSSTITIDVETYAANQDANVVIYLASEDYSVAIGHSYNSNKDIYIGDFTSNATKTFVNFQKADLGVVPEHQVQVAAAGENFNITGVNTYHLVINGTSITGTVSDSDGTHTAAVINFNIPAGTKFTAVGATIDASAKGVGIKSVNIDGGSTPQALEISDNRNYADVRSASLINITATGVLNIARTDYTDTNDLKSILAKISGSGTIVLSGDITGPFPHTECGNTGCTIKMAGVSTWIAQGANCNFPIVLENNGETAALTITGANDWQTYTFSGKVSGNGNIVYSQTETRTCTFDFTGDLNSFGGKFITKNTNTIVKMAIGDHVEVPADRILVSKLDNGIYTFTSRAVGTVYAKNSNMTEFSGDTAGSTTTLADGDTVTIDATHMTGGEPSNVMLSEIADHNVIVNYQGENGISCASGIPAGMTVTINSGCTMSFSGDQSIADGAKIAGQGTLNVNSTVTINGAVTMTVTTINVEGGIKLADNATLAVTKLDDGKVTTDVAGKTVAYNDGTYSLTDASSGIVSTETGVTIPSTWANDHGVTTTNVDEAIPGNDQQMTYAQAYALGINDNLETASFTISGFTYNSDTGRWDVTTTPAEVRADVTTAEIVIKRSKNLDFSTNDADGNFFKAVLQKKNQ